MHEEAPKSIAFNDFCKKIKAIARYGGDRYINYKYLYTAGLSESIHAFAHSTTSHH
jgi:sulfur relay (sulfurtransferase) DsrF/TusC family protein